MKVEIVNKSEFELPKYESLLAAGVDVRAIIKYEDIKCFEGHVTVDGETGVLELSPGARVMIPTGIYMAIEPGYEAQVRSRSGKSLKEGLIVVQGVGTIDADYRGECKVCIANISHHPQQIQHGERVAQFVFKAVEQAEFVLKNDVSELSSTERGAGGFGNSGKF